MEYKIDKVKHLLNKYTYLIVTILAIATYNISVELVAIQNPWVNVTISKASVSTVALLIAWVILTEKIGKKKKWTGRKIMLLNITGIGILMLTIWFTPL